MGIILCICIPLYYYKYKKIEDEKLFVIIFSHK